MLLGKLFCRFSLRFGSWSLPQRTIIIYTVWHDNDKLQICRCPFPVYHLPNATLNSEHRSTPFLCVILSIDFFPHNAHNSNFLWQYIIHSLQNLLISCIQYDLYTRSVSAIESIISIHFKDFNSSVRRTNSLFWFLVNKFSWFEFR